MGLFHLLSSSGVAALGILAAGAAIAETRYDAKGSFSGKNESAHYQLMEGHMAIMGVNTVEEMTTADPNNPQNGATGTCFGLLEFMPDGFDADGYCHMTDTDGDTWAGAWTLTKGNEDGTNDYDWTLIGGTGKWVGASGSGKIHQVMSEDRTAYTNEVTGEIVLK